MKTTMGNIPYELQSFKREISQAIMEKGREMNLYWWDATTARGWIPIDKDCFPKQKELKCIRCREEGHWAKERPTWNGVELIKYKRVSLLIYPTDSLYNQPRKEIPEGQEAIRVLCSGRKHRSWDWNFCQGGTYYYAIWRGYSFVKRAVVFKL